MGFINALAVLAALIGLAMGSVGWFITFFTSLFQRRWIATLLSITLLFTPIAAKRLKLQYPFWLMVAGITFFVAGLLISEWVNPRLFLFT